MINPILAEVTRGSIVESRHRGAYAVCDATGKILLSAGDVETHREAASPGFVADQAVAARHHQALGRQRDLALML